MGGSRGLDPSRVWITEEEAARLSDEEADQLLAEAPEEIKERLLELDLAVVEANIGPKEVARLKSTSEEKFELENVELIRERKARGFREWNLFLKSLPREAREQIRDIERRYHL